MFACLVFLFCFVFYMWEETISIYPFYAEHHLGLINNFKRKSLQKLSSPVAFLVYVQFPWKITDD